MVSIIVLLNSVFNRIQQSIIWSLTYQIPNLLPFLSIPSMANWYVLGKYHPILILLIFQIWISYFIFVFRFHIWYLDLRLWISDLDLEFRLWNLELGIWNFGNWELETSPQKSHEENTKSVVLWMILHRNLPKHWIGKDGRLCMYAGSPTTSFRVSQCKRWRFGWADGWDVCTDRVLAWGFWRTYGDSADHTKGD